MTNQLIEIDKFPDLYDSEVQSYFFDDENRVIELKIQLYDASMLSIRFFEAVKFIDNCCYDVVKLYCYEKSPESSSEYNHYVFINYDDEQAFEVIAKNYSYERVYRGQ